MEELKTKLKILIKKKKDLLTICKELDLKDYEVIEQRKDKEKWRNE